MKFKLPLTLFCLFLVSCEKGDVEIFDSRPIFSSSLSGKWVLVNYWADWCPPCIIEFPYFNKINEEPNVTVIGFHFDQFDTLPNEEVNRLMNKFNVDFKNLSTDPRNLWSLDLPDSVPTTYIIKNGEILDAITYPLTPEKLRELVATN